MWICFPKLPPHFRITGSPRETTRGPVNCVADNPATPAGINPRKRAPFMLTATGRRKLGSLPRHADIIELNLNNDV
jgi:hypothetical protein